MFDGCLFDGQTDGQTDRQKLVIGYSGAAAQKRRNKSSKDRTWSAVPDALLGVIEGRS